MPHDHKKRHGAERTAFTSDQDKPPKSGYSLYILIFVATALLLVISSVITFSIYNEAIREILVTAWEQSRSTGDSAVQAVMISRTLDHYAVIGCLSFGGTVIFLMATASVLFLRQWRKATAAQLSYDQKLQEQSQRDGLTGLFNKITAEEMIGQCLRKDEYGTMLLIDIDGFKQLNDCFGHSEGDRVLRYIGESLQRVFCKGAVTGRVGGDEIIIYLPEAHQEDGLRLLNDLWNLLKDYGGKAKGEINISVGISVYPEDGVDFQELFDLADQDMYRAKRTAKSSGLNLSLHPLK